MIQFCNVSKVYDGGTQNGNKSFVKALDGINLKIEKGEMVFLVGASGAGKSTLQKLLFKEESPTTGQILVGGRNIVRLKKREIPVLRRRMGIVFQDFKLLEDMTVAENVAFAMEVLKFSRKEIKNTVPKVLEQVGIAYRANHFPRQLSGGEKQRAAIGRAIINNPPILLADEPTGNLDPDTSWEIMKLLEEINLRGTTMLIATHDRDIVDSMHKRVVTLSSGKIVSDRRGGYSRV